VGESKTSRKVHAKIAGEGSMREGEAIISQAIERNITEKTSLGVRVGEGGNHPANGERKQGDPGASAKGKGGKRIRGGD